MAGSPGMCTSRRRRIDPQDATLGLSAIDEDVLVDMLRQADESCPNFQEAFAEFARRWHGKLFALSYSILRDSHAAEDVVQDCFVALWRAVLAGNVSFPHAQRLNGWLYVVVGRNATQAKKIALRGDS